MPINIYFRGIKFAKNYLIKYLQAIFYAAQKGELLLTDGTKKIEFSNDGNVWVGGEMGWEEQNIPCVLVSTGGVTIKPLSLTKDVTDVVSSELVDQDEYRHFGSDIQVSLNLSCRARTAVEKDNLVDIVCIYLAHPHAKDFFLQQNIVIHSPPVVSADSTAALPGIDFPIFISSLNLGLTSQWDYREEITEERLETIVVDIIAELNL